MASRKKAAAAPVSALAARKAQEAEAQRSKTRRASISNKDQAASSSRTSSQRSASGRHALQPNDDEDGDDSMLEVVLPLPTASQAVASRVSGPSAAPSPSTNRRRPSATQDAVAALRLRRSSVTASARPETTPKAAETTAAKVSQSTPSRGSARNASSSTTTPASSRKKRKAARDSEDDLDQAVQDILDEFNFGESDNDDASEIGAPILPPRKKRASQTAKTRTPTKSPKHTADQAESLAAKPKRTPAKRSSAKITPADQTPAKKTSTKRATASETPKRAKAAAKSSPAKENEATRANNKSLLTADEKRRKAAERYFAGIASQHGKTHVGPSFMPVEDQLTGFLAFGEDQDDGSMQVSAAEEDVQAQEMQSDADYDNSSEDDEQDEAQDAADTSVQTRRSRRSQTRQSLPNRNGKGRNMQEEPQTPRMGCDSDDEKSDNEQAGTPTLTREALLDAIPYSSFNPIPDGNEQNMYVLENKRKRAREALYFGLQLGETLVFLGIGHVEVLRGCAQIGGALISSAEQTFRAANIYAPICNPLPILKSVPEPKSLAESSGREISQGDQKPCNDPLLKGVSVGNFSTVVKVTPLSSPITALGQVCPIGGLATPFSMPPNLELNKVHQLSTIKVLLAPHVDEIAQKPKNVLANGTFSAVGLSATYIPHKWQKELDRLGLAAAAAAMHPQEESIVALVRGSKKVGKSTFSRMTLETLLSMGRSIGGKVAYLELDLGQSDFGPPGMVSLHIFGIDDHHQTMSLQGQEEDGEIENGNGEQVQHSAENGDKAKDAPKLARRCITLGPGWCQPRVPVRAHFIGDVSPRDDPESYVAAVHDLIECFRLELQPGQPGENGEVQRVPLVINTQGWIKGLGADLAARLEPMLRPTHIFDVIPRGSPEPVPAPTRGRPWLDADGAILGSGPEIVTLESVSQLEFVQGAFGQRKGNGGSNNHSLSSNVASKDTGDKNGTGDGGSIPPRYITDVGSKLAPAESRLLNMMSYLYTTQLAPAGSRNAFKTQGTWDFSEPLVYRRPLVIDVAQGLQAGIRVLALGSSVPDSFKLMALNSSIVAIVVSEPSDDVSADEDGVGAQEAFQATKVWKRAFDRAAQPSFSLSTRCVGLGVVRSIDAASGHIHLLTPLDPTFLSHAESFPTSICKVGLVKGALELPVWASLDFDAIKEARESRLDVAPESEQLLAGMPRWQVPYLEWPHATVNTSAPTRQKGKHIGANGTQGDSLPPTPILLGSEKRRVRRNLMRKSQFA